MRNFFKIARVRRDVPRSLLLPAAPALAPRGPTTLSEHSRAGKIPPKSLQTSIQHGDASHFATNWRVAQKGLFCATMSSLCIATSPRRALDVIATLGSEKIRQKNLWQKMASRHSQSIDYFFLPQIFLPYCSHSRSAR
jgi:hypothetical protein